MNYIIKEFTIKELYDLIRDRQLDLRPPYQRNFIWGKKDQQLLIDSIEKGFPLPNFFIYQRPNGILEMVDGQQRAETICRFINGDIKDLENRTFNEIKDRDGFYSYKLNVTVLSDVKESEGEDIASFYALVNKQGMHLNSAEINKAQYSDKSFLLLVEELLETEEVSSLDLFSTKTKTRMNDRTLIEEIVAYMKVGFFDKREAVDELYITPLTKEEIVAIKEEFMIVIRRIVKLNDIRPINKTRYRQRNDFFTLFSFIHKNNDILSDDLLNYQYGLLLWVDDNNMIRPSNEEIELMQKYAYACVAQSNSKKARETRLSIFELLLLHKSDDNNKEYERFLEDLRDEFNTDEIPHIQKEIYSILDYSKLQK